MSRITTRKSHLVVVSIVGLAALAVAFGLQSLAQPGPGDPLAKGSMGITMGPDVTVMDLPDVTHWGAQNGIHAYSVGTDSCNVGSVPVFWCDNPGIPGCDVNDHPVIAQNLYRYKDGRFEQLGMSWLKHGFLSLNSTDGNCMGNDGNNNPILCQGPPLGGNQLGVGCTDFYSSGLNGFQPLGRRSEVDATTGEFPFPPLGGGETGILGQRIQVRETDLEPAQNPGARYWVEGHYIAADDAAVGNGLNNASYREVVVDAGFDLDFLGGTVRELPAIFAWQDADPSVEIVDVNVRTVGGSGIAERFHAARRVTESGGVWHYEIVIHNMNSDRGARSFTVRFPAPVMITGAGFHDVDPHSGEPYSTVDWTSFIDSAGRQVRWFTEPSAVNPNANALRWSTAFSFWFDAEAPPDGALYTLELFEQGSPGSVAVPFVGAVVTVDLFEDGFESGDITVWSSALP